MSVERDGALIGFYLGSRVSLGSSCGLWAAVLEAPSLGESACVGGVFVFEL